MTAGNRIAVAEGIVGHEFEDKRLLAAALTHPSAAEGRHISHSYERLEFLGDSVLGAIVANDLYHRYPDYDEGALTRLKITLVSGETLSSVASEMGLGECIRFGGSELGTGARGMKSALENVFEAIVGALYLDAGYDAAREFVQTTLGPHLSSAAALRPVSPKSLLQEITQRDMRRTPAYRLVGEEGPAHDPTFSSVVVVDDEVLGRGEGSSKKASQKAAALDALERMGAIEPPEEPEKTS